MLSIVWGILARQWMLVSGIVGTYVVIGVFVALPSAIRTRRYLHESFPLPNLRTINTAEATYLSKTGRYGTMTDLIAARLLDDTFSQPKAGYNYSITMDATGLRYTAEAVPVPTIRPHGYYTGPDGEVRYSTDPSLAPTPAQAGRSVHSADPVFTQQQEKMPVAPFKIGDRVRIPRFENGDRVRVISTASEHHGRTGTITGVLYELDAETTLEPRRGYALQLDDGPIELFFVHDLEGDVR